MMDKTMRNSVAEIEQDLHNGIPNSSVEETGVSNVVAVRTSAVRKD